MGRRETQFFTKLSYYRLPWMLALLYVTTRRKPQLSILVIDQQNVLGVHNCEIRDEMLRWSRRLCRSTKGSTGIDPCECLSPMLQLECVQRID